jgi:hypothetical protein
MHFVPPIKHISHHPGRRGIDNRGTDNIRHIPVVLILRHTSFFLCKKLSDSREMDVASKDSDANALLRSKFLQFLNEPISLSFMVFSSPMIVQIVQYFNSSVEFIDKST